jgi:hypothetical protein
MRSFHVPLALLLPYFVVETIFHLGKNCMSFLSTVPVQKKYGLQVLQKKPDHKKGVKQRAAIFMRDECDEEEEEDTNAITRTNRELVKRSTTTTSIVRSMTEEEAKIYDYDGAYDDFKSIQNAKLSASTTRLLGGTNETAPVSSLLLFSIPLM